MSLCQHCLGNPLPPQDLTHIVLEQSILIHRALHVRVNIQCTIKPHHIIAILHVATKNKIRRSQQKLWAIKLGLRRSQAWWFRQTHYRIYSTCFFSENGQFRPEINTYWLCAIHVHWLTTADLIAWGEPVPVDCAIEGVQHRLTRTRVLNSVNEETFSMHRWKI